MSRYWSPQRLPLASCRPASCAYSTDLQPPTINPLPLDSSGLSSSVIGCGAWAIGGGAVWGDASDDAESIRTIQAALDAGINLLAPGWGHSERLTAKTVSGRRDSVILATLTCMSLEQRLLTGKIGMDHVFKDGEHAEKHPTAV